MTGRYNTQLNNERAESEQMTQLFVNASGRNFTIVMEILSRNPCVARNTAWEELAHATVSALKQFRFMKLK
jgi:hypothetical protein